MITYDWSPGSTAATFAVDSDTALAKELLSAWDGELATDSSAASVWVLSLCNLMTRLVRTHASHTAGRALGSGYLPDLPHTTILTRRVGHLAKLILRDEPGIFAEGWPAAIARAMGDAVRRLRDVAGDDPGAWR